nr:hypothetical protein [Tanacetum cinerariifolium]
MNKLVKGNLVRDLPSKIFENDHTCVVCQKGKQHKATCKAKLMSSISQPLQMLHMDLFGQTSVMSINHKKYCLVMTDDFSRDQGEYSNARTLQQNKVAKRKNRTLIKATRTMLADFLLPVTFWVEAVNTACYVLNRALVTKSQNKTPYELLNGRTHRLDFMRPFGCLVTILNTLDPLGKFKGKANEGFLVGYSVTSKAFRVFNTKTKKVEENPHVRFLENNPNVAGTGPNWLFDIDSLTNSMNYIPFSAGNQTDKNTSPQDTNGNTGTQDNVDVRKEVFDQHYIVLPLWSSISSTFKSLDDKAADDKLKNDTGSNTVEEQVNKEDQAYRDELDLLMGQEKEASDAADALRKESKQGCKDQRGATKAGSTNSFNTFSNPVNAAVQSVGAEADFNNMDSSTVVSPITTYRVHIDHTKNQILGDPKSTVQTKGMAKKSSRAYTFMEPKKVAQDLNDKSWVKAMQEELLQFSLQKIVDFLTSSSIYHSLTISPTIYASNIKQFWNTATSQTINDEKQIHAIVDGKTMATLNEPTPQGEGSGSGLGRQKTMGGAIAQIRSEGALIQSIDPALSTGYTVLDLEIVKTAQAKEIASLKKRITKLEQRQSSRFSGIHPFRVGASKRNTLGRRKVSKQGRKNLKSQQIFQDIDDVLDEDTDTKMIVEDNSNGEKGGSIAETVSTARPDISAARPEVNTAKPKTPPITTTLFDDEDVTIAHTLVKMKSQKAKEKGVAFKDVDDSTRPIKSITTLQPLPTIDPKDKGKGILQEPEHVKKTKKRDQDQIERDDQAALAEMYNEVQAQIDADHELAARLTHKEQGKYTVEERSKLLAEFFERRKKQIAKERAEAIRSKPPTKTQLRNLMMTYLKHTGLEEDKKRIRNRKKRAAGSSSKHKSPKKQKVNDQDSKDNDKEHRKYLKVVPDDDKVIDYETLDVKSLIVDCESQVLGTNEAGDVHVYKLTRLDGSYRHFSTFSRMLKVLNRQDVLDLHKSIIERFLANDQEGYGLILLGDLKTLVESKKRYPLTKEILEKMLSSRLEAVTESTLALDLINFIKLQIEENKGGVDEVFGMHIPKDPITDAIHNSYYNKEYMEMAASKPRQPTTMTGKEDETIKKALKVDEEGQPASKPQVENDEYNLQRGIQMSLESLQAQGQVRQAPVGGVASKPDSMITQKLLFVEGKGKDIVSDEQVAQSLLDLQKPKKQSIKDQYIFQRRTRVTHDVSTGPYTQSQDDTSANVVHDTLSPVDSTNDAETAADMEQFNNETDTEILNIVEEQGVTT